MSQAAELIERIAGLGRPRVLVVGDLILDRYVWCDAERISQEAPVPLLRAESREERLGGASSVATMLAALGAEVTIAGVVGRDAAAHRAGELLGEHGIDASLVRPVAGRPTTLKERYIGRAQHKHPQQMFRVDYEVRDAIDAELIDRIATGIESRTADFDVVLVSDYDKGVCTPALVQRLIGTCRERRLPVLVDPIRSSRPENYDLRYRGCTAMTPNRLEAGLATGIEIETLDDAYAAARTLRDRLGMDVGLVTLDSQGIAVVDADDMAECYPVRKREVYDITGAGDMVLATLGMVLAAGGDFADAVRLANVAGGLEVERIGVATLTREDLVADIQASARLRSPKIVGRDTLLRRVSAARDEGRRIVFTNGCFDVLHAGHVQYLAEARDQGDLLVVGLNSDDSVRRQGKGPDRPVNDEHARAAVLAALEPVDCVHVFDDDTPLTLIEAVAPDVLVKGADYAPDQVVGRDFVEASGGRLHLAPLVPGHSTTATLERLQAA